MHRYRIFIILLVLFSSPVLLRAEAFIEASDLPTLKIRESRLPRSRPHLATEFSGESLSLGEQPTSLGRILRQSPSVMVHETGGEGHAPIFIIRGQDPGQTRFFLAGVPLSDAEFNSANAAWIPLESFSHVDVYAEGIPVALGADGLGGAIDFPLSPLGTSPSGRALLRAGSYGMGKVALLANRPGKISVGGQLSYLQSDENFAYFDDAGTPFNRSDDRISERANNRCRRTTAFPRASLSLGEGERLELFSLNQWVQTEIPGPTQIPAKAELGQLYRVSALQYSNEASSLARLSASLYEKFASDTIVNNDMALNPSLPSTETRDFTLGMKVGFELPLSSSGRFSMMTGSSLESFQRSLPSQASTDDRYRVEVPLSFGLSVPLANDAVKIKPALLAHFFSYGAGDGQSGETADARRYLLFSPRLGIEAALTPAWQWRGSFGGYYRAPTMMELFGSATGVTPSPDLRVERAWKGEVGTDLEWRRPVPGIRVLRASYTASLARAKDLIAYLQNSQQSRVATNVGESLILSNELALVAEGRYGWRVRSNVAFLRTKNLTDIPSQSGQSLPNRPAFRSQSSAAWEQDSLTLEYTLSFSGTSYWDLANLKQLSSTWDHTARLSLKTRSFGVIALEGQNLANTLTTTSNFSSVQTTDNTTGYLGYPAPGRRVFLLWNYDL